MPKSVEELRLNKVISLLQNHKGKTGCILMNPPYDKRIYLEDTSRFYRDIGRKLHDDYKGFQAWIISPYTDLIEKVNLKKIKSYKV
jgi:23S rRNA G2445 N2-methylase RlmL